jgi:cytochrome c553
MRLRFSTGFLARFATGFAGIITLVYAAAAPGAEGSAAAKADPAAGQKIASGVCVACHGADGNSTVPANPILAGQSADYIATQLAAFKAGTRPSPIMQGMAAPLSPDDMRNLGAWFESQKHMPMVARDKALALRGEQIWRGGIKAAGVPACAGCHGAAGLGIPAQYPRLSGQYSDLTYGWLKAFAANGRPHPVMSPIASKMTDADMKAVAEYAAGLR